MGVRLAFKPKAGITVRGAVLDGVPVDRPDARSARSGQAGGRILTYLAQLASRLAVQPDLQCVIHPSTNAALSSARAFQIRFEVTF